MFIIDTNYLLLFIHRIQIDIFAFVNIETYAHNRDFFLSKRVLHKKKDLEMCLSCRYIKNMYICIIYYLRRTKIF